MSTATLHTAHLAFLGALLPDRPFELGPAPADLPDDENLRSTIISQLSDGAGLVTAGGAELTDLGDSLLRPLVSYDEAYWGMFLLHNERQPLTLQVPDEWLDFMKESLATAAMSSPRTYILIARSGSVVTAAVRHQDRIDITQFTAPRGLPIAAADYVLALGDPQGVWKPLSIAPISLPVAALNKHQPPPRPPATDAADRDHAQYRRYTYKFVQDLRSSVHLDPRAAATLTRLLTLDHVASAQFMYSAGPQRLTPAQSVSIDYFHDAGVAVSRPRRLGDGTIWKHISPAAHNAVAEAFDALASMPARPRNIIASATAANPAPDAVLRTQPQH